MLLGQALDGLQRVPRRLPSSRRRPRCLRRNPACISVSATCTGSCRQYDEAKAEFERELAIDPNHAQALAYLGDIEMKRNNPGGRPGAAQEGGAAKRRPAHRLYRYGGDSCAAEPLIRRRSPPSCKPRNWIPCNPTLIFAWDGCTRRRETTWPRRRSFPNFANFIKKRTTTSPLRCPSPAPACRNKTVSLIRQRQKVTAKSGWYEARFQRSLATWSPAVMCGGDRSHVPPEHRCGVRPEPWHS